MNGKNYRYSYDETGRLVRNDISDGSWFQNDYNTMDLSTSVRYHFSELTREINYGYSERDYLPASTSIISSRVVSNGYDTLERLTERSYTTDSQPVTVSYDYRDWTSEENRTTGIVNHVRYSVNGGTSLSDLYYVYDRNGNITQVRAGSTASAPLLEKYTYDSKDQLIRHDSNTLGKTFSYSYDAGGNITVVCEYDNMTGNLPETYLARKEYSYGDAQWKDLLTEYNGSMIGYDEIGNMISFNRRTYSWNGRKLEEITNGEEHYSYAYNANGIRTSKTVNGITTEYFLNGDQILAEKTGDDVLWYFYDVQGHRIGLMRNNTIYYYLYDLIGNVTALAEGSSGNVAANYVYDAWGNCTIQNIGNETIGTVNPFRYKGYYYDRETGLYYLNSRYYNSEVGRFLNEDQ